MKKGFEQSTDKEMPVSMGTRLTNEYLVRRKIKDDETYKSLVRVCDRARTEFSMYGRDVTDMPEAEVIADYINAQIPKLIKENGDDAAEIYAAIMDAMTDFIRRKQKEVREKTVAKKKAA
ncbi:MAG: hypothetical protein ABIB04_05285 [Patescibacteria group bacterium]